MFSRFYNAFKQNFRTIEVLDSLDEVENEETEQSLFTNKILSKDMNLFVYQPITMESFSDTYFKYTITRDRNLFKRTVYTIICNDTKEKIIYLIETHKYKHKMYEIYLNYTPRKYVNYLPIDLEKIIYSFDGEHYNKDTKNGLLIGKILTDNEVFTLDLIGSELLKDYEYETSYNNMNLVQKKNSPTQIRWTRRLKDTFIEMKNMKIDLKNKKVTGNVKCFTNKQPIWSENLRTYLLNFHGGAKVASSKNTIIKQFDSQEVAIFGKMNKKEYRLSIKYPFSLIQGVCLIVACMNK